MSDGHVAAYVKRETTLTDRFLKAAAHQAMTCYLDDWEQAYARLGRQITALRAARDERREAKEAGLWP